MPSTVSSRIKLLLFILTAAALFACAPGDRTRSSDEIINAAVRNQSGRIERTDSPEYHIRLASQTEGAERQQHLLKAAELLIERGDIQLAENQLQNLKPEQLQANKQTQIKLLAARIALANNNPAQAIQLLPPDAVLAPPRQLDAAKVRADASFLLGYYLRAVEQRVAIDSQLDDTEREQNHKAIWMALSSMPEIALAQAASTNRITRGWIELARIMRHGQTSVNRLQESVLDWGARYPDHPVSNAFIDNIITLYLDNQQTTGNIAVMLPMSGDYATVSKAIQSGFLSAYYDSETTRPHIRFYDTSAPGADFDSLYQQALRDGAQTIIGPLNKTSINRLAQSPGLDVPVLALNYTENPLSYADNLYQFGLLPEDEARQAAELAIRQNKRRAAVFTPDSDWGRRLQHAFIERFTQLGGKAVSVQQYDPKADDYSRPIRKLFNIDQSTRRHRDLQRLLDMKLSFTPYRRQDVDMIFLAATSRSARGIMPAFRFHRVGKLPVYATSHVYNGKPDPAADRDLNGLVFCDLPWLLTSQSPHKQAFARHWPELQHYTRLYALGLDVYHLVRNLPYLESSDFARFAGETGNLSLDETGRIHRELIWAKFTGGHPVYLDLTSVPALQDGDAPPDAPAGDNLLENNG